MLSEGEDDLICDFAQYYHVLDWRGLPLRQAATLAFGLPEDARVKRRNSKILAGLDTILLARICDALQTLVWFQTEDGHRGVNRPQSLLESLVDNSDTKPMSFASGEEFDTYYEELAKQARGGEE